MKKVFITDYIKTPDIEKKILGKKVKIINLGIKKEEKFIQNFIKEFDEIMLDKNIAQDEKWNKIILARINLTKEVI